MYNSEDDDMEVDASKFSKPSNRSSTQKPKYRRDEESDDDDDDDAPNEKLMLSMKELKVR